MKDTNEIRKYYDQIVLNRLKQADNMDEMLFGKIIGYRKVKVPKHLTIKIPVISKAFDDDSEYGTGEFKGYLISFKEVKLFRIGTIIEKQPIRKKPEGKIVFKRYTVLNGIPNDVLK